MSTKNEKEATDKEGSTSTKNEKEATDGERSTNKAESPSELVDPPKLENFYHLTSMVTLSDGNNEIALTDHGLFEDPADARAIARKDLKRSVEGYDCLIIGENAKFTMEQYLLGVLGAEKDIRCEDKLWRINERLEEDGSWLIECKEVACDGPKFRYQYRIKKYKMPKITRKRKATTEVPLAETPTGLTSNIN